MCFNSKNTIFFLRRSSLKSTIFELQRDENYKDTTTRNTLLGRLTRFWQAHCVIFLLPLSHLPLRWLIRRVALISSWCVGSSFVPSHATCRALTPQNRHYFAFCQPFIVCPILIHRSDKNLVSRDRSCPQGRVQALRPATIHHMPLFFFFFFFWANVSFKRDLDRKERIPPIPRTLVW